MCCVYWLNKLLYLLLFETEFLLLSSSVGKYGILFLIRIFEFVNFASAESLLAFNLWLLLCLLFSLFPLGFVCIFLVIAACTVSQVRLVAVLTKGHWADKGSRLKLCWNVQCRIKFRVYQKNPKKIFSPSQRPLPAKHKTHKTTKKKSMPPAGFEPKSIYSRVAAVQSLRPLGYRYGYLI